MLYGEFSYYLGKVCKTQILCLNIMHVIAEEKNNIFACEIPNSFQYYPIFWDLMRLR